MFFYLMQIAYLSVILALGALILFLRRKAKGSLSLYKIVLILAGSVLFLILGKRMDLLWQSTIANLLLIVLAFELSMRIRPENLKNKRSLQVFLLTLMVNMVVVGILGAVLLDANIIHAIMLAVALSAVEYFLVDELKAEGDAASPMVLLLAFSMAYIFSYAKTMSGIENLASHILIGIGIGVFVAIITFKLLKPHKITWVHELTLIAIAYLTYLAAEFLNGFGMLAVLIVGTMFANSYVRKKSEMETFSPFIFKSVEILIFILIGFMVPLHLDVPLLIVAAALYMTYVIIRLLIVGIVFRRYSIHNKMILSLAPKGVLFAGILLVFASNNMVTASVSSVMLYILLLSLFVSWAVEVFEDKKIARLDRFFEAVKNLRYGRKRTRR